MRKRIVALLLALVMAFALVACGGQENNQTSGNDFLRYTLLTV